MKKSFDVFLSHNSRDKPAVHELAKALRARGLAVWLDEWELVPGRPWQEALEEIIETCQSSAVLVGKDGLGPWQDAEMRGCLSEFVNRNLPVIPVLLPGAPVEPKLPFFLRRFTWVDLRGGLTEEGIDRLQWGVTGHRPERSKLPTIPTADPVEQPAQKAQSRWGVPVWIGLLTLLGLAVFRFAPYFSKLDEPTPTAGTGAEDRPVQGEIVQQEDQATSTPNTGELASQNASPTPVPTATQTKPAVTALETCISGKEREENGIVFVRICPGTFTMGSENNRPALEDEKPAHQVTLSEFWIGKTEVTNEQYRRFRSDHWGEDGLPAHNVSWLEANAACEHFGGRLPSEAEWEYAARAGRQTDWSFGNDSSVIGEYVWYSMNSGNKLHPVGMKKPNTWGLHDMHGNVWEWVADWYGTYPSTAETDPTGPTTGKYRVVRGGGVHGTAWILRSAIRGSGMPEGRSAEIGFRCVFVPRRQP